MSAPDNTLSSLQRNIDAMKASQERFRQATLALAGGQFESPGVPAPAVSHLATTTAAVRTARVANAIDATFELMQERAMADIYNATQRTDALARFNAAHAQTAYAAARGPSASTQAAPPTPQGEVVDVEAIDVTARPTAA